MTVSLHRGFFIIVLDLRLTKWVRGCREIAFNFLYLFHFSARGEESTLSDKLLICFHSLFRLSKNVFDAMVRRCFCRISWVISSTDS